MSAPPAIPVAVTLPVLRNVTSTTVLSGQFSAVNKVTLLAQVSGYLTEIHFQDGQSVRKGDLLFIIDPRPYEVQLQQANAQYQTAAASLDLAAREAGRTTRLNHQQFASNELLDQRTEEERRAAASLQAAEAAVHAAQLNLEFTRIEAPFDGRVSSVGSRSAV